MKHLFFTFSLLFLGLFAFAQPGTRINLTQLEKSPSIDGSRIGMIGLTNANGDQRYAFYVNVGDTCVNYTPTATGNSVVSIFVQKCGTDSIWYVDWEGRSILLAPYGGGGGANDYDWLIIQDSAIPSSINDSIYTYKYASVGARYVWPTAELLVNDSTGASMAVIQGDRNARLALYDGTNQTFSVIDQGGVAPVWYLQDGNNLTFTAASGTPGALTGPYTNHMQIRTSDSTLVFNRYPSSRADTNTVANFLFTDATGTLRSRPVADFPGIGSADSTLYKTDGEISGNRTVSVTNSDLFWDANDASSIIHTVSSGVAETRTHQTLGTVLLSQTDVGGTNSANISGSGIALTTTASDAVSISGNAATYTANYAPFDSLEIPNMDAVQDLVDSLAALAVKGSGTTNYVSKFTSANTIGDSYLYDPGTKRIGINTTSPQSIPGFSGSSLHIYDNVGLPSLRIESSGNIAGIGLDNLRAYYSSQKAIRFIYNNTPGSNEQITFQNNNSGTVYNFAASSTGLFAMSDIDARSAHASSAILTLQSTTRGFLPPRGTETERNAISPPVSGLHFYNTTVNRPQFYNGTAWQDMGTISGSGAANQVAYWNGSNTLTGSNFFTNNTTYLQTGTTGADGDIRFARASDGVYVGRAFVESGNFVLRTDQNRQMYLRYNNTDKLVVGADGVTITDEVVLSNIGGGVDWTVKSESDDNLRIYTGANEVLEASTLFRTLTGRFASESSSTPTVTYGSGAGTGPTTVSLTGGFNSHIFTFTTGTSPATDQPVFTITLPANFPSNANPSAPCPANPASVGAPLYCSGTSANSYTFSVSGTLSASTTYSFRLNVFGY